MKKEEGRGGRRSVPPRFLAQSDANVSITDSCLSALRRLSELMSVSSASSKQEKNYSNPNEITIKCHGRKLKLVQRTR